jgi:hypothetical protein
MANATRIPPENTATFRCRFRQAESADLGNAERCPAFSMKEKVLDKPELKQFGVLNPADFERHSVWVQCHVLDYDEPWYDELDEETFRPWTGALPVDPSDAMFLVPATFRLSDGTQRRGFATPASTDDIGTIQPQMFVDAQRFGFWGGMLGVAEQRRQEFYAVLGKSAPAVFPISFAAGSDVTTGRCEGIIEGFYKLAKGKLLVEQ